MRTMRDLAGWVETDPPLQAGCYALSILLQIRTPRAAWEHEAGACGVEA
jgi:hypothetical protein